MRGPLCNLPEISPADRTVAVLAVSPLEEDHSSLRRIFSHSNWRISTVNTCQEAIQFLRTNPMAVVVCEQNLPDGTWKDLLGAAALSPCRPVLVVASKSPDDGLWAEVLNLDAYDVLSKPFDRAEVMRIISLAWLHWKETATSLSQTASPSAPVGASNAFSATA